MKARDGKLYAEITLRDVIEKNDVSELPMLSEIKRLYEENDRLRKAAGDAWSLFVRFGAVHPYNLPEVDRVRESLQELGIEVIK